MYNPTTNVMVSYDNADSFGKLLLKLMDMTCDANFLPEAAKGTFIANNGLAGFAMWETAGDSDDILLDSIRTAMGGVATTSGSC